MAPWSKYCPTCYWYQVMHSTLSCKNGSVLCTWESKEEKEKELLARAYIENKGW